MGLCRRSGKSKYAGGRGKDSEGQNPKRGKKKQRMLDQFRGVKGSRRKSNRKQNKMARMSLIIGKHNKGGKKDSLLKTQKTFIPGKC